METKQLALLPSVSAAESAAIALRNLASANDSSMKSEVLNVEGVLTYLVKLLSEETNPSLQKIAAEILRNSAAGFTAGYFENFVKRKIVDEFGALACLVKLLSEDDNPVLQSLAAETLANLVFGDDDSIKREVAGQKGALEALAKSLIKYENNGSDSWSSE